MLFEYLRDLALPIVLALIGLAATGGWKLSRRTPPPVPAPAPLAAPAPVPEPADGEDRQEFALEQIRRLVLREAEILSALASLGPLVVWADAGGKGPVPTVPAATRRLLGLAPTPPSSPEARP